ncbi:response regulator [Rhodoferax sp. 4810]|uniref:histidine kinase n=1 Tax=Thiospirillum jenense TaxID=1653858 RepID=A0A839HF03_9GAMM|nr:ATP-binding protein [Thiospirillum jenense]MBB1073404.1 response regulator [Rhodoferax jenense]MBB1125757.1 response regulator [Thiospirillum jenense]
MKVQIKTKLLTILILTALIPIMVIGWVGYSSTINISQIAAKANRNIADLAMTDSSAALSSELKTRLQALTEGYAGDINELLQQVQSDTVHLADFANYLYTHSKTLQRYAYPSTYEPAPENKMFGSRQPNENSWLGVFGNGVDKKGNVSKTTLKEIYFTEYMDIVFKSVAKTNSYAVQLYINTANQLSRGMPFVDGQFKWVDATIQFAKIQDVTAFDFYYLADAKNNPDRGPEWTELYWDPAGLGWMVSSIAPVYLKDKVVAVTGIDITLERIIKSILNLQIEDSGFAFLMSERGQAIAFPERAAEFLEFHGSLKGVFKENEAFKHSLTEVRDAAFQSIIKAMQQGQHDLTTYTDPKNGQEYFFAYHAIPVTGWSVAIVVPAKEVIAPALLTNQKIEQSRETTSAMLNERSASLVQTFLWLIVGTVLVLILIALLFARTISRPIQLLAEGSRRVGAGELDHRIQLRSGDEIEALAVTFNQMAIDLKAKIDEIETANQELLQLDQLKSKFISMASHELRTPLIAIQGYVDLIREGKGGAISPEQHKMLDTVSRNATRLARIVTELLDVSRIEENKLVLEFAPVSLQTAIQDIAEEQQPYFASRGHRLTLELENDLPPVNGDTDRISQVIINLLGNAIKYTPDNGQIMIRAYAEKEQVHIEVHDTGIGIKPEDIGKLFKRFSTLGDITKHRTGKNEFMAGGTGLGLSIVQGIVQAHGGNIWVESEYGKGSIFHVTLPIATELTVSTTITPIAQPSELITIDHAVVADTKAMKIVDTDAVPAFKVLRFEQEHKPQIALPAEEKLSVLIVDDEPDVITFTRDLLEENYTIFTAQTSATAIKEAINKKPDLLLLDAWIPGISGYDICRTLKRNSHTRDTPIIIFTAATQAIDEERARAAGADGFVTKPFRREQLVELIERFRESP